MYLDQRIGLTPSGIYIFKGIHGGLLMLLLGEYSFAIPREALSRLKVAELQDFEAAIAASVREFEKLVKSLEEELLLTFDNFGDDFFEISKLQEVEHLSF